jgi:predicted DCC family thiol-disulfide oxidoreductase YuxK
MNTDILPDPSEKPGCDVVIWDGQCNFCRTQVRRLHSLDSGRLAYLSLHDERVRALCPNLTDAQLMEQMWVITSDGRQFGGADAGKYLSRHLPRLWWLFPLLHLPGSMPFWRWIYRRVAVTRYRISGKSCDTDGACDIHLNQRR